MPITAARLREIYGTPSVRAERKALLALDAHCRNFIAHSTFIVLATSDGTSLDISPKGDPKGFVAIEDDQHLILPDRPGNNRIDGLLNIVKHPKVALLFLIPAVAETLRVNGHATILDDPDLLKAHAMKGRAPKTVTRIKVEEAFLHCGKAPIRSGLWQPDSWPDSRPIPNLNVMIRDQVPSVEQNDVSDESVAAIYTDDKLY